MYSVQWYYAACCVFMVVYICIFESLVALNVVFGGGEWGLPASRSVSTGREGGDGPGPEGPGPSRLCRPGPRRGGAGRRAGLPGSIFPIS